MTTQPLFTTSNPILLKTFRIVMSITYAILLVYFPTFTETPRYKFLTNWGFALTTLYY